MTGKELGIILAGATIFGGTAGAAAVAISGGNQPAPAPVVADTSELEARLERLEDDLRQMTSERDELRSSLAGFRERLETAESRVDEGLSVGTLRGTETGMRVIDTDEMLMDSGATLELSEGEDVHQALQKGLKAALDRLDKDSGDLDRQIGFSVDGTSTAVEGLKERLDGLRNSMALRMLPEEERWEKARNDLNLNTYQENELKAAIAERNRLMEDAMIVEEAEDDGRGGTYEVRKLDPVRAREANKVYNDRVTSALTEEQSKNWQRKGYSSAFGSGGLGSVSGNFSVMTIQTTTTTEKSSAGDEK